MPSRGGGGGGGGSYIQMRLTLLVFVMFHCVYSECAEGKKKIYISKEKHTSASVCILFLLQSCRETFTGGFPCRRLVRERRWLIACRGVGCLFMRLWNCVRQQRGESQLLWSL